MAGLHARWQLTVGMRRGLLPILIAMFSLVLAVHQASASSHVVEAPVGMVHMDIQPDHDAEGAVHAAGCCSISVGIPAGEVHEITYDRGQTAFDFEAGSSLPRSHLRSKQYRPPRSV